MTERIKIDDEQVRSLRKRHLIGALVRSGSSLFMGFFVFVSYLLGALEFNHLAGVTASIAFLILLNPPSLWILNRITDRKRYKYFSLFINFLEIAGYTAVIHFFGGIEAAFLIPIYAALITYVGVVAPQGLPFIIAGFSAFSFSFLVVCEYFGFLPHQSLLSNTPFPAAKQIMIVFIISGLLFVVAFIATYTSRLLRQNRDTLRNKNFELEKALVQARESDRIKSEFVANMSHELRTPLNHIIGFTQLLVDKEIGDLNETQDEYLNDVLSSSQHLLSLINDILDLSKIEVGKMELQLSEVRLREVLQASMKMVKAKAILNDISLSLDMDGTPEIISADERKIRQIFYNLLSNAVKFTPKGGSVKINASHFDSLASSGRHWRHWGDKDGRKKLGTAEIAFDKTDDGDRMQWVEIIVSDTGIGIGPEDLEKIFKPFEQVDSSMNRRFQGTGLGLTLSKTLVELHGGRIWAKSDGAGQGSKFGVILPIQPFHHQQQQASAQ